MPLFSPLDLPGNDEDPESGLSFPQFADSVRAGLDRPTVDRTPLDRTSAGDGATGFPSFSGTATATAPQPPEQPDFPRIDVEEDLAMDQPQKDEDARRRDRLTALLGALGTTIAAAGDDPVALNVAGGLTKGATDDLDRRRQSFRKRQQAFQNLVSEANQYNRKQRQREAETDFERRLSAFEQGRKDRRQRAEANQERIQNEREHERTLDEISARARQRRWTDYFEERIEDDDDNGNGTKQNAPTGYEAIKVRTEDGWKVWEMLGEEPVGQHGGLTEQEADRLRRELNRRGAPTDTPDVPADTADTAGPTSSADPTTRGLGRRPDGTYVKPQELGMTTGGGGGGGNSQPRGGNATSLSRPGPDMSGHPTEQLVDDALTLAWERGPGVARQRLDRLADQGALAPQRARRVKERMGAIRELDRVAVEKSPQAARDTVRTLRRRGEITDEQARRLLSRVEARHMRR